MRRPVTDQKHAKDFPGLRIPAGEARSFDRPVIPFGGAESSSPAYILSASWGSVSGKCGKSEVLILALNARGPDDKSG